MVAPTRSWGTHRIDPDFMRPYGSILSIDDCSRPSYSYAFADSVEVDLRFHNRDAFMQFRRDLLSVPDMRKEYNLREKYPSVKQAWEEYQLLLKLTK